MQFYASSEYLKIAAEVYFKGRETNVEIVQIGDELFRLLVVDGKRAVTDLEFVDYHQPLHRADGSMLPRRCSYARSVVREVIEASQWDAARYLDLQPAPFVDWSKFATFESYQEFLKARRKGLYKEQLRRRRRLAEQFGELVFCMNDENGDVLDLAMRWKVEQFHATGAPNYLADPRNIRHFELLREHGLLTSSTLRAGGRLLSVWLGFVHDGVWSGWIFAYDHEPALRKYSVGHQLLHSMLKESHRRKHREFDFSVGDEDYKWFYSTHARVLGPIGRPPLPERVGARVRQTKRYAKRILMSHPRLLQGATSLTRTMRKRKSLLIERLQRMQHAIGLDKASG